MSMPMKNLLFVDDDASALSGLRRMLRRHQDTWNMTFVGGGQEALNLLETQVFDAVIADISMPGIDGLQLLSEIQERWSDTAVLMLTGHGNESIAVEAMKSGAEDYLCKGTLTSESIRAAITKAINSVAQHRESEEHFACIERMSEKLAEQTIELAQLSRTDPLTRLFNRRAWEECATLEHNRSVSRDCRYGVIMLDVDHFKSLNDTQGHAVGDEVLCRLADLIRSAIRGVDIAGRYGGEEFVVLLQDVSVSKAMEIAENIRTTIWDANIPHEASLVADRITVSLGVAIGVGRHWERVVREADKALYLSKERGRNRSTESESSTGKPDRTEGSLSDTKTGAAP